jgi:predicted MPP superfamily phosphohydrolase
MALSPFLKSHPWYTWGIFALLLLSTFLVPVLSRFGGPFVSAVAWASFIMFGAVSTYIIYLGLADLSQFLLRRYLDAPPSTAAWALWAAVGGTIVSVAIGYVQAMQPPKIRRVEVPILGLNQALEDFTIVQISDLHINSMTSMSSLEQLVLQVNELNPNLIAITGDLVDGSVKDLLPKVEVFEKLNPRNCVCFVTGNHEYYSGDLQNWLKVFNKMNWCVLMNDNVFIQRNEAKLAVVGIPDSASRSSFGGGVTPNLERAFGGIPKGTPRILLHHRPENFIEAERADIALQLSGHTHAGQYFPWTAIVPLFHHFPYGLKRYKRLWMYTNVGTGYWGPPNRFLRSKELTLLVLKRT